MKIVALLNLILLTSCSTTYVSAPKTITIYVESKGDAKIESNNSGSDLSDAKANQESKGDFKIPFK